MIKDNIENIRRTKGVEYAKYMESMIDVHRLTQEELTKTRNMISEIPICK